MTTKKTVLHWINGEWIDTDSHRDSINPATSEVIGTYADGNVAVADKAIAAALDAFQNSAWKRDHALRARVLEELAVAFEKHTDELIEQLSLENGKIKPEATFEVNMVPSKLRYFAALALTEYGRSGTPAPDVLSILLREPMGVAGIIVPWNSPIALMVRSLAAALAAGCTAVIKMPGQTAQINGLLSEVMSEVPSLPRGVINLFSEAGAEGSKQLIVSPDVPVISFTGSTATGRAIAAIGAQRLKRMGLELGGKTPHLIFDDVDLEVALPVLEKTITVFAGQ